MIGRRRGREAPDGTGGPGAPRAYACKSIPSAALVNLNRILVCMVPMPEMLLLATHASMHPRSQLRMYCCIPRRRCTRLATSLVTAIATAPEAVTRSNGLGGAECNAPCPRPHGGRRGGGNGLIMIMSRTMPLTLAQSLALTILRPESNHGDIS